MKKVVSKARRRTRVALAMMDLSGRTTANVAHTHYRRPSSVEGDWYAVGKDLRVAVEKQTRAPLTRGR